MQTLTLPIPTPIETDESFRAILATAQELNEFGNPGDVRDYLELLTQHLATSAALAQNADLAKAYAQVVTYLRFVALPLQDDRELSELFRKHLLYGLSTDVDLKTKLELLFLMTNDEYTDSPKRRQILAAISENDELIGQRDLNIPDAPMPLPSSVRNWILDFLRMVGTGKPLTALEVGTYMTQSANVRQLAPVEQDLLRQVFLLYTFIVNPPLSESLQVYLRSVSETPKGIPLPTMLVGTPVVPPAEDFRSILLQSLFEESAMEEAIYEEEKRLLGEQGFDLGRAAVQLVTAHREGNTSKLEAALFVLARSGHLPTFIGESQPIQAFVEERVLSALLPELKSRRPSLELRSLRDDFRRQPNRPVYVKNLLQTVLTDVWRGDTEKAAREAVRITSLAFRQGFTEAAAMAFFDAEWQAYRWAANDVDSQGVPILA